MPTVIELGTLTDLDQLSADLKRRIEARGFAEPRLFNKAAEQILVDHPTARALVLPPGTVIEGDLRLDYDSLSEHGIGTVAALGNLEVRGRILNEDSDGGPFLIVDGDVHARQIVKGGASFTVLGSIKVKDLIFCDYNHGQFLVAGNIDCAALVINDQDVEVGGEIRGRVVSEEQGNMRELLVAEVFEEPDDPEDEWLDGDRVRERLAAGMSILK